MLETDITITFLSDWHVGSGLGNGAIADAVLNRDVNGLLWLPGSAIKGALREAAWRLALCDAQNLKWLEDFLFGTNNVTDRTVNKNGLVEVGEGRLQKDLRAWLLALKPQERAAFVSDLTFIRQQTKLTADKQVEPHSLRAIECGIAGLSFHSCIAWLIPQEAHPWFKQYLACLFANVKSIGGDRARGLGRCKIACAQTGKASAGLPGPAPDCLLTSKGKVAA